MQEQKRMEAQERMREQQAVEPVPNQTREEDVDDEDEFVTPGNLGDDENKLDHSGHLDDDDDDVPLYMSRGRAIMPDEEGYLNRSQLVGMKQDAEEAMEGEDEQDVQDDFEYIGYSSRQQHRSDFEWCCCPSTTSPRGLKFCRRRQHRSTCWKKKSRCGRGRCFFPTYRICQASQDNSHAHQSQLEHPQPRREQAAHGCQLSVIHQHPRSIFCPATWNENGDDQKVWRRLATSPQLSHV